MSNLENRLLFLRNGEHLLNQNGIEKELFNINNMKKGGDNNG